MRTTLEIAISTPEEAVAAALAGADRLELSSGLDLGGLTPSIGLFTHVRRQVDVPVWVLLRPRSGGFVYSVDEIDIALHDASAFLAAGADGLVFGALELDGEIASNPCSRLLDLARGRVAFHRAFDFMVNPQKALDQLITLGFSRVLTSGGKPSAIEGSRLLAELIAHATGHIEILPGGGIRPENVAELVHATKCNQVHAAVRSAEVDSTLLANSRLAPAMGADMLGARMTTDPTLVARLRAALDCLPSVR